MKGTAKAGQYLTGKLNKVSIQLISAYGIAVKNGFKGTEEEWLNSLSVNQSAIAEAVNEYLRDNPVSVDPTLSLSGISADAKATGDGLARLSDEIAEVRESVGSIPEENPAVAAHIEDKNNPHGVTASQIGLGNVNNTADIDKPVSTAQSVAIANALQVAQNASDKADSITLESLGAAASSHNHATSNITSGTLGVARGGTGKATHTSNAVLTGNGTSAVNNVATASGALYATAANGAAKFGTLPIAQGGTGQTTGANAIKAMFAAGNTILSSYQYGTALPTSGFTAGRIFFKKVGS